MVCTPSDGAGMEPSVQSSPLDDDEQAAFGAVAHLLRGVLRNLGGLDSESELAYSSCLYSLFRLVRIPHTVASGCVTLLLCRIPLSQVDATLLSQRQEAGSYGRCAGCQ